MVAKIANKVVKNGAKVVKFAQGMTFKKLFFVFLIGSVVGAIYEDVLIFVRTFFETGTGVWMLHRGVIYGPFNVVYGFGAVVMCILLCRKKRKSWQTFLYASLLGGVVEYGISFLQEKFLQTYSWDYSNEFLNINGRTTLPIMLIWGLVGLLFVRFVYPWISRLVESIPPCIGEAVFWAFLTFMVFDVSISWTALLRQTLRYYDVPAYTPVGRFYDSYYTDQYLEKYFPNMQREVKQ